MMEDIHDVTAETIVDAHHQFDPLLQRLRDAVATLETMKMRTRAVALRLHGISVPPSPPVPPQGPMPTATVERLKYDLDALDQKSLELSGEIERLEVL